MNDRPVRGDQHTGHGVEGDLDAVAGVVVAEFEALAVPDHTRPSGWVAQGEIQGLGGPLVFLVHPTTHRVAGAGGAWFGDPTDPEVREGVERRVRTQASAFGGELWAPHYRQASTRAFVERDRGGAQAYSLAYDDVAAAFTAFLAQESSRGRPDRPVVLVGHSQGARHVQRLVRDFFDHPGLAERLVAAYVIGVGVAAHDPLLGRFPLAAGPQEHGVSVVYQACLSGSGRPDVEHGVCVDPAALAPSPPAGMLRAGGFLLLDAARASGTPVQALPDGRLHPVEVEVMADVLAADVARRTRSWRAARAEVDTGEPVTSGLHVVDLHPGPDAAPDAAPVVLLHKLGGWGSEWAPVARMLARRRRVLVVDLPGHGDSSSPEHEAPWVQWPAASAAQVLAALEARGVDRFHLIGASLGGVVGVGLAVERAERVLSLTLIATSATPALSAHRTVQIDREVRDAFGPDWLPLPGHHQRAATTSDAVRADRDLSRARAGRWVRASERGVGLSGVEPLLGGLRLPVLCLDGERAPYRRYAARVAELVDDVRFAVVARAGAFVHQEQPEAVVGEWERFVVGRQG